MVLDGHPARALERRSQELDGVDDTRDRVARKHQDGRLPDDAQCNGMTWFQRNPVDEHLAEFGNDFGNEVTLADRGTAGGDDQVLGEVALDGRP